MRRTLKQLLAEYGRVALWVYLAIFVGVLVASWTAIQFGWRPESATGNVGTLTAAYLVTKVTQPLRIAATLALTPLVAKVQERFAGTPSPSGPGAGNPAAAPPSAAETSV